ASQVGPRQSQVGPDRDRDHMIHLDVLGGLYALVEAVFAAGVLAVVGIPHPPPVVVVAALGGGAAMTVGVTLVAMHVVLVAVGTTCPPATAGNTAAGLETTWAGCAGHVAAPSK